MLSAGTDELPCLGANHRSSIWCDLSILIVLPGQESRTLIGDGVDQAVRRGIEMGSEPQAGRPSGATAPEPTRAALGRHI